MSVEQVPGQGTPSQELVQWGVARFADGLRNEVRDGHPHMQAGIDAYLGVLQAGGKRARGMLTVCGYKLHDGDNMPMIGEAAGAIEAMHAYLLVVDDVADNADTRRGKPTAHIAMQTFLEEQGAQGKVEKTAADMAISGALVAQHWAQLVLGGLDAPTGAKLRALNAINTHLMRTNEGQVLDMASTTGAPMTIADITSVARGKTAYYSFQMPLETGALLAGASDDQLQPLADYSLHAGLAFQLQDDVMGVFGDEAKMGKSPKSDIIEGKQTLLYAFALQGANGAQRRHLEEALGNPELSDQAFALCQEIIVATGALAKIQRWAREEVERAHAVLDTAPPEWPANEVAYLRDMASFVANRDK